MILKFKLILIANFYIKKINFTKQFDIRSDNFPCLANVNMYFFNLIFLQMPSP